MDSSLFSPKRRLLAAATSRTAAWSGKSHGRKAINLGTTVAHLRALDLSVLEHHFGRYHVRLYELARGIDESEVVADRPTKSISVEDTFEHDVFLVELEPMIPASGGKALVRVAKGIPRATYGGFKT